MDAGTRQSTNDGAKTVPETDELTFAVRADIARAFTPPPFLYRSRELREVQRERVFARGWQVVPEGEALGPAPATQPFLLAPGVLDEPLVLTLDEDEILRCLSNVCTHRGNIVCPGPGQARELRCRYHGRRYGLDGSFRFMPEFEGVEGFPGQSDHLEQVEVVRWGPLVWSALAPAVPLARVLKPVEDRVGWLLDMLRPEPASAREFTIQANWALYCDNYLEGFHIPYVHQALNRALDYGAYETHPLDHGVLQVGIASEGASRFELPPGHPDEGKAVAAYYFFLFPNIMLNFYPWGLSLNWVLPRGVEDTEIRYRSYRVHPEVPRIGAGGDLDQVEHEDDEIVEEVQRGMRARLARRGRYSPTREVGVHHFHRMLAAAMFEEEE